LAEIAHHMSKCKLRDVGDSKASVDETEASTTKPPTNEVK